MSISVILHNIRSAHNVGSIFRTADGAGVSKIFLTGYTPTPQDRFGRENVQILKTSLGATKTTPYENVPDIHTCIHNLKESGHTVIAVEQTLRARVYDTYQVPEKSVFVFGNEITGIEPEVLELSDVQIHIPMHGSKESLNVSVCAGIILFHIQSAQ